MAGESNGNGARVWDSFKTVLGIAVGLVGYGVYLVNARVDDRFAAATTVATERKNDVDRDLGALASSIAGLSARLDAHAALSGHPVGDKELAHLAKEIGEVRKLALDSEEDIQLTAGDWQRHLEALEKTVQDLRFELIERTKCQEKP